MRRAVAVLTAGAAVLVTGAGACSPSWDGRSRLEAVRPVVDGTCDTDGVTLSFDVEYFGGLEDHSLYAVTVGDLDPACEDETLRLAVGDETGVIGTGSGPIVDGRAVIRFDPLTTSVDTEGNEYIVSNLEVYANDVEAIRIRLGD